MSYPVPFPHITAKDEAGQLAEIRAYLQRLAGELRVALDEVGGTASTVATRGGSAAAQAAPTPEQTQISFNAMKSLIITSADIVQAYYDQTVRRLADVYLAQSDFGTFREQTERTIRESAARTEELFHNIQQICTELSGLESSLIEVSAHIRTGLLDYDDAGVPIFGVEVGQRNRVDGVESFRKLARFTADRLSFFDRNGTEVATVGDYKLSITAAEVSKDLKIGGYRIDTTAGLAFRYEGGTT